MRTWMFFVVALVVFLLGYRNLKLAFKSAKQNKEEKNLRLANGWIMTGLGVLFIILGTIQLIGEWGILR